MVSAALLAAIAVGCLFAAARLRRAAWPLRGPHAGVFTWQTLGLTWGFATIGALLSVALAPYGQGIFRGLYSVATGLRTDSAYLTEVAPAIFNAGHMAAFLAAAGLTLLLLSALLTSCVQILHTRRRHRDLLQLVARDDPEVPGARILDHPAAAAYCLPGVIRSHVVISAGALALLDRDQLAAVLAHEHAHLRQRHDLVLLPFSSLKRAFPGVRFVELCYNAVALLVEVCADEHARRQRSPKELAMALIRFGAAPAVRVPTGALAAAAENDPEPEVVTRVARLLDPAAKLSPSATAGVLTAAALLMTTTVALWHLPL